MIPVRDNSGSFHGIVAIYDSSGREIAEVRDNQGRLLFKNWNEIQGSLPLTFKSYADYLKDYRIYGNTIQNGTPTPENPVEVQGCGEYDSELDGYKIPVMVAEQPHILFTENVDGFVSRGASWSIKNGIVSVTGTATRQSNPISVMENRAGMSGDFLITKNNENTRIAIFCLIEKNGVTSYDNLESILRLDGTETRVAFFPQVQAGTYDNTCTPTIQQVITTPVYIGSEPLHKIGDYADYVDFKRGVVVRRIKKLVLTGAEPDLMVESSSYFYLNNPIENAKKKHRVYSSHFMGDDDLYNNNNMAIISNTGRLNFTTTDIPHSVAEFASFLAQQYEAGTPVTVWYVLAEPEEEPLENLLPIQTIKGSDVLTADTTVQPSEMYVKGKIKPIT